jgi:hypothetical protein
MEKAGVCLAGEAGGDLRLRSVVAIMATAGHRS